MVKKGLILSSLAVIVLLIAAFYMISRLVVHETDNNFELMMKRTSNLSQSIEKEYTAFLEDSETGLSGGALAELISSGKTSGDTYKTLKRLFLKHQDLLRDIIITDGTRSRKLTKPGVNQIEISDQYNETTILSPDQNWQVTGKNIVFICPVMSTGNTVTNNIIFKIDLDGFIHSVLSKDNVDKNNWILFSDNTSILQVNTYNPDYQPGKSVSIDVLPHIAKDTRQGLAGYTQGRILTGRTNLKVLMAYFPILIFNNFYSIIFCQDKSMMLSDIYMVIGILSIIFVLILGIALVMFYVFIRTLRKGENKLLQIQSAVEHASDLIIITDMNNQPIFVNNAFKEIFGTSYRNLENSIDVIMSHNQQRDQLLEMIAKHKSWTGEVEIPTKNDETITCLLRSDVILDKNRNALAIMYMATDIAERKKAERMKNEFISTVSHELRTPLTSIRGSLGLIRGGVTGEIPAQTQKLVEIAYTNSERLVRLINDILDIEKIEAGKMEFHIQRFEVLPLVGKSIEMMRNYAHQFKVSLNLTKSLPQYQAYLDPDRFEQVLVNLISNAAKFSPSGGTVDVEMKMVNDAVIRISVSDKGVGIPDEYRAMMFKKFAQVDSSDSKAKGGTGLGLSISKAIIEKFGGRIDYESTLNAGSTFYVEIPATIINHAPDTDNAEENINNPKILIVEDDADIAALLKLILEDAGYRTAIAYNAADALTKTEAEDFAAMTLDLLLPDKQGITLVQELRDNIRTAKLPIIVVSAVADQQKQQFHGGFDILDWIQKPIDLPRLKRVLQQAVFPKGNEKYTILHVEDDPDNIEIVAQILRDKADIVSASTIRDAQIKLQQNTYDLVILDVSLPDGNGMDLLPFMRKNGKHSTPVMVFSASETPNELQDKVSASLVKSKTNNDELVDVIQTILNFNKAHNEET